MLKKLVLWCLVLIAAVSIFSFSAEPASLSEVRTYKITEFVARAGNKLVDMDFGRLHYYIRKGAHFSEYMVLAFLMLLAIRNNRRGAIKQSMIIFLLCITIASFDEWTQRFSAGRSGNISDVLIDSLGALIGIFIFRLVFMVFEKLRYKLPI